MRYRSSPKVEHEPSGLYSFTTNLLDHLYKKPLGLLQNQKDELIRKNSRLHRNEQNALGFRGKFYYVSNTPAGGIANTLRPELRQEFKEMISRTDRLLEERETIRGLFQQILMTTRMVSEIKTILPESLHSQLPESLPGNIKTDVDLVAFKASHQEHLDIITRRITFNLLEVVGI
jgi:hypothetical protein